MQTAQARSGVRVFKFGGSSLASASAITQVAAIVRKEAGPLVLVVSAMHGITDLLLRAMKDAVENNRQSTDEGAQIFRTKHLAAIEALLPDGPDLPALRQSVLRDADDFAAIGASIETLRELTERTIARGLARGERTMAALMTAVLRKAGLPAVLLDATEVIKVEPSPLGMYPQWQACDEASAQRLTPVLGQGKLVVIPGFIAAGPMGELVLLGRGGSDFSAAILAASLQARELVLFKEVDGLMTADPRHVEEARVVSEMHYREAAELAYYGAKILHPCTIIPLADRNIPLSICNTFFPERPGSRISSDAPKSGSPVKALTAIQDQAVIAVEGKGMMGVPGVAGRTFSALARLEISVAMISQASSESSICFVVPGSSAHQVKTALEREFKFELASHLIDHIKLTAQKAIIAIVGLGMSGARGTAARAFQALAQEGINIDAIAQGSSELNISVVLDSHLVGPGLKALHREFRLEKSHALPDMMGKKVSLALVGFGQIGTVLAEKILHQKVVIENQTHSEISIVNVTDSQGTLTDKLGLKEDDIRAAISKKRLNRKNGDTKARKSLAEISTLLRGELWNLPFSKSIFVDCTADETAPLILEALDAGMHVVLANKKPLAVDFSSYQAMFDRARRKRLHIRYESTVGAGLPVLDTLNKLASSGDLVHTILGCFSGTLGFLVTELEGGLKFSQAVRKAFELGYTEPDPREDLSGMDVARKALILSRTIGMRLDMADIDLEPLFPQHLSSDDPEEFLRNLTELDDLIHARVEEAAASGQVLRYVARLMPESVSVRLEAVPRQSVLGQLKGTDNLVTIRSKFYDKNPLVVTGPGAGADVTAAGVLNDIVAIAQAQGG